MNSYAWQGGKNLKRHIEASGRVTPTSHWVVATWLAAQEEGIDLEQLVQMLILTKDYKPAPLDRAQAIRDLGY